MQTSNASDLVRSHALSIPVFQVTQEVNKRLRKLAQTVHLQGFRPGKAPERVVRQQYGAQVYDEVLNELAQESFVQAVSHAQQHVAGTPIIELVSPRTGDTLEFTASFEVFPEVRIGDLSQVRIERPVTLVQDDDVERTIQILRRQKVSYRLVERAVQEEDRLIVDYQGTLDGVPVEGAVQTGQTLILGKSQFLPAFELALLGMQPKTTKQAPITFPVDYAKAELAGKTLVFELTVQEVQEPLYPELDAEFVNSFGVSDGSVETLRHDLRTNLERETRQRVKALLKERALKAILAATPLTLPEAVVKAEITELRTQTLQRMNARTAKSRPLKDQPALPDQLFEEEARRRVALSLIMGQVITDQDLKPEPHRVRSTIEEMSQAYDAPEDFARWMYSQPERLKEIEALVLEDQVVDWICSQAQCEPVEIPFKDLAQQPF